VKTTVCCLLYGDYPQLAERCLTPLSKLYELGVDTRIGCNDVSAGTEAVVNRLFDPAKGKLSLLHERPQVYKYPMMRRLFECSPITTKYVTWFDDDSYIKAHPEDWVRRLEAFMDSTSSDMVGSVYTMPVLPGQDQWRRLHCDWFLDRKRDHAYTKFATGGWWAIKADVIKRYDWPHRSLKHRGGDVLLGELIFQQSLTLSRYKDGVAINADANGKESASKRRGYDEPPIGSSVMDGSSKQ
jgi:hypothetical protein